MWNYTCGLVEDLHEFKKTSREIKDEINSVIEDSEAQHYLNLNIVLSNRLINSEK